MDTHPDFGNALEDAKKAGVEVLFLTCHVEPGELYIIENE
jgi:sugar fermentation stimulation protein A